MSRAQSAGWEQPLHNLCAMCVCVSGAGGCCCGGPGPPRDARCLVTWCRSPAATPVRGPRGDSRCLCRNQSRPGWSCIFHRALLFLNLPVDVGRMLPACARVASVVLSVAGLVSSSAFYRQRRFHFSTLLARVDGEVKSSLCNSMTDKFGSCVSIMPSILFPALQ